MAATPRDLLEEGLYVLSQADAEWVEEDDYLRGRHPRPFAPPGVDREYKALRDMAVTPWIGKGVQVPVQRLKIDGFRTGRDEDIDANTWRDVWQANNLDSRSRMVFTEAIAHPYGVMSVWPNAVNPQQPIVRPESSRFVYVFADHGDVFASRAAVKRLADRVVLEDGRKVRIESAVVHEPHGYVRYENRAGGWGRKDWREAGSGRNPMGRVPFVEFVTGMDPYGTKSSMIRPLFPLQCAIDTVSFDLLLAAQFAAYRQRIVTGWDPVLRDAKGQPLLATGPDGKPVLDHNGHATPLLSSPGRPGVDRLMAFPGTDTKVFDLAESNLKNYVDTRAQLVGHLMSLLQVPPQYVLGDLVNISGDGLDAAEATLMSLIADLQTSLGESVEEVMRLANVARGDGAPDLASEVVWGDGQSRSFAQVVDGVTKLIASGFPRQAAFEMLPTATPQKVRRWMELRADELQQDAEADTVLVGLTRDLATGGTDASRAG